MQLVAAFIIIDLVLWIVYFVKSKKLFENEKDKNIKEFRAGMERLLADAQRQTALSVNLLDEKIKSLKAITAEAERKIAIAEKRLETLQKEKSLLEQSAVFQTQINAQSAVVAEKPKSKRKTPARSAAEKYKKNSIAESLPFDADAAYALTGLFQENAQKSLFEEGGQSVVVTQDGDSYGKIPLVKPEIVVSDNPIVPKKDFSRQVRELSELGRSIEDIAAQTGRTITEVQLVIDMLS